MTNTIEYLDDHFFVAGVNYRTAPVEVRERMAVAHSDRAEVSRRLQQKAGLNEVMVLWTCNRVEIYGAAAHAASLDIAPLFECLSREAPSLADHIYCHRGTDALKHLYKVTAGLDSMVLGETQITGQVRDTYESARQAGMAGKILNTVFQTALRTAKAIRTQTSIGRGARSVGGLAVAHAREALGSQQLENCSILMIGAGEMAACCLLHLQKKGHCSVVVANRSPERAGKLAAKYNGTAIPLDDRYLAMVEADVVISSTGSPDTVINRAELELVMAERPNRPLVVVDIAVPRDVDPDVAGIKGVHLHDIDALQSTVQQTLGRWEQDLEKCEAIIEEEINSLILQFKSRRSAENLCHNDALKVLAV